MRHPTRSSPQYPATGRSPPADGRPVGTKTPHQQTIDQYNAGICISWWQMIFNNSFYVASHGAAINFLISIVLRINSIYLCFDHGIFAIHLLTGLTSLFPSFWLFFVLFWMLWMLVTMDKPFHVPHATRIATWETFFTERIFSVSGRSQILVIRFLDNLW